MSRIAVTGGRDAETGRWAPKLAYMRAVESAGGAPFCLERPSDVAQAEGLLLSGGGDVAPRRYGHTPHPNLGRVDEERDELELEALSLALARDIPVLAVCRGMQVLVVALGGTLWQDLPSELPQSIGHGRGAGKGGGTERATHGVMLRADSLGARTVRTTEFEVNSSHHQAAQTVGGGLIISGWAPDGIIEAVELPGARFVLGVQWHPEDLLDRWEHAALFASLIDSAGS
ncbi:MAG: gamma-glutamyl-gamma-aminobutyrate hydrolase family protein [Armatimonadota bacterium]|nr:MAG: gamma-glutamyl-gamma-aminobutyrate hydrolase family protein [Armatimonadota bacterium]